MTNKSAKDLLAQADRLMRQNRAPEELPVLTDLVLEPVLEIPKLDDRVYDDPIDYDLLPSLDQESAHSPVHSGFDDTQTGRARRYVDLSAPITGMGGDNKHRTPAAQSHTPVPAPAPVAAPAYVAPTPSFAPPAPFVAAPGPVPAPAPTVPTEPSADVINAAVVREIENLRHDIFSQAMQQLELQANHSLKRELRVALQHELERGIEKVAVQCAEVIMHRVRTVVSNAVDAEIERLRERLNKR